MKKLLITTLLIVSLTAQADNVLRIVNGSEPKSIDPQLASESAGSAVIYDTFMGLMTYDANKKLVGGVAESWDISEDGKKYTFHLRDSKWSDGVPLTAHDFVFSWQRAVDPASLSEYGWILSPVKNADEIVKGEIKDLNQLGVRAVDDKTFEVELNYPTPYFLDLTSFYTTFPAPRHVIEKAGNKWTQPEFFVSNGAFKVVEWKPQATITVAKSDYFWDKDNVKLDKVIYYAIEEDSVALKRYRADELDIVIPPSNEIEKYKKNSPHEIKITPYLGTYYYVLNLEREPLKSNVKLREALNLAIDRKILVDKILKAGQMPATGLIPPGTANSKVYQSKILQAPREEQIKRAQQLYAEAGFSKEKPFKTQILYNTSEGHKQIAIAVASMWKQILGVQTELMNQEWKVMLNNTAQGNFDIVRYAWTGDYNDPYTFLGLFRADNVMNSSKFKNSEYEALLNKAVKTLDLDERAELLYQAEKILIDSNVIFPFYHYVSVRLVKPNVKGYNMNIKGVMYTRFMSKD